MNEVGYVLSLFLGVFLAMTGYQYITQKESPSQQSLTPCNLTQYSITPLFHYPTLPLPSFHSSIERFSKFRLW
jgi:hypothetical protein